MGLPGAAGPPGAVGLEGRPSGLNVYDADDVVIGPIIYFSTVTFLVDGQRYAASVGPDGWSQTVLNTYFFDTACSDGPYILRTFSSSGQPARPNPLAKAFFRSLFVVGPTGFYETGQYLSRVLSSDVPNVWLRENATGPCTALALGGSAWFEEVGAIQIPVHRSPFTIR
jgi:hypothetical protein